ncbi:MAG: hypothetical protein KTV72_01050 [Wolbachia endosymbiont of Melophagus ovinus]|nr:hypothetical protein [Wolbachia endosymbiont of Melophagus ovinus]
MGQGGATNAGSEYLTQGLVELIQRNDSLKEAAKGFLDHNKDLKDLAKVENVAGLLSGNKGKEFLKAISGKLPEEEKFKKLAEQIGKDRVMMEKLETLGNQLLIQGVIGGAAITALTGALAGTLAIGGVAGALMGGGLALAGLVALVAIAAIGYAIYQLRGEIKESAESLGKAVKSFVKDLIDKLPVIQIQDRDKNFYKLYQESSQLALRAESEEIKNIQNKAKVIEMLQDKDQRSAIEKLIKDGTIQNFSEDEMKRLIEKGLSTHETDKKALEELMEKFLPEIMKIGTGNIKEVEEKVNEKVKEMKPPSKMETTSHEQVDPGKTQSP